MHSAVEWHGALSMATDILWAATGRRWRGGGRIGEAVLRAAPPRAGEGSWPYHRSWGRCACFDGGTLLDLRWRKLTTHFEPVAIRLPHPDVTAVTTVLVAEQQFDAWRLDGAWIARTDGRGWQMCRDRTVVTYTYGIDPPAGGRRACVELAVEIGRSWADKPDRECRLPTRIASVTRQGVTYEAAELDYLDDGLTGITDIDLWIRSVNPYGRKQTATVWSPDIPRARSTR
jgi:hypothetical protein